MRMCYFQGWAVWKIQEDFRKHLLFCAQKHQCWSGMEWEELLSNVWWWFDLPTGKLMVPDLVTRDIPDNLCSINGLLLSSANSDWRVLSSHALLHLSAWPFVQLSHPHYRFTAQNIQWILFILGTTIDLRKSMNPFGYEVSIFTRILWNFEPLTLVGAWTLLIILSLCSFCKRLWQFETLRIHTNLLLGLSGLRVHIPWTVFFCNP